MLAEERTNDREEALRVALSGWQEGINVAMPGIVQSFDANDMTASVQPALQYTMRQPSGALVQVTLPLLVKCPVQFIGGGSYVLTFTPMEDDECLVVFAQRCIDAWWQNGDVQPQAEYRLNDWSDGFCIPGFRSVPRVVGNILTTGTELRSVDRTRRITLNDDGSCDLLNAAGSVILGADGNTTVSGNLTVLGMLKYGAATRKIALDGDLVTGGAVVASGTEGLGS